MIKKNKHIEIVRSAIPGLSSMSQLSCDAVYEVLKRHYTSVGVTTINEIKDIDALVLMQPDLVFLGMKYVPGPLQDSRIWVSELLESIGIEHTGSEHYAIENEMSKPLAKVRVRQTGIHTANFLEVKRGQLINREEVTLSYPLFVKPSSLGGGEGIDGASLVHNLEMLQIKISDLAKTKNADVLIEEYLPGREFSVAILRNFDSDEYKVMPIELVAPIEASGNPVLSQDIKRANTEVVSTVTDPALRLKIEVAALGAFKALGARDYGRIDIRLDNEGIPHFLEANLIPSLIINYGSFPKACELNIRMGYEAMILHIVNLALSRDVKEPEPTFIPLLKRALMPKVIVPAT